MLVIGLTGGIGSGKSQASQWFEQQGITIIDADILAHEVVAQGSPTLNLIVEKFGEWALDESGGLNRRAMREYVFGRPQALKNLEAITHPAIRERATNLLAASTSPYTILVAPLLIEASKAGLVNLCHRVLVIDCDETLQLARASQRDAQNVERIKQIMANQLNREVRLAKADDVAINNGTLEELYGQLMALHQKYLTMAKNF